MDFETRKRQLENNLDTIESAYKIVNEQLAVIESELSRTPHRVVAFQQQILGDSEGNILMAEWNERLRMLAKMVSNGKQSWLHTEHDLREIIASCRRNVLR